MAATQQQDDWLRRIGIDPAKFGAPGAKPGGPPGDDTKKVQFALPGSAEEKVVQMDEKWQKALKASDWQAAAEVVNGFSASDMKQRLAKLSADQVAKVHKGAIDNRKVGQNSAVALATVALQHPILGTAQTARADAIEKSLSPKDAAELKSVLDSAKSEKEKQYITKGLASGHSIGELKKFAAKIAGKDEKWLQDNLSLTGNSQGKGVKQQWSMSCNATAQEAVRGEMDPIWALKMHEENPHLTEADEKSGTKLNPSLGKEQKKLLESKEPDGSKGGDAVPRGSGKPADGRWNTDLLNKIEKSTGVSYERKTVGEDETMDESVTSINDGLAKGAPVPIVIGDGADNASAHYVVIVASDPGPPRYYSIHDPASGDTVVRSEDQLRSGNLDMGWTKLFSIEKPTEVKVKLKPKKKAK
jgi:hypothetical protein